MINLGRVAECRTIQVHNIGDVYEDILSLYFESKRNGYGDVVHVEMCRENNYALLKMVDKTHVRSILAIQNHTLENQTLHVEAFYDCLGPTPPHRDTT
ncbi:hypothetical protein LSAT2_007767 [Lamellibrachia satsuma]|nr:hypothetical protein LSAT2_007767 [Lamellibrachia satsuma]